MADEKKEAFSIRETSKDVIAAFVGSVTCAYTGQPFDTVKVRIQSSKAIPTPGAFSTTASVVRNEGITALWKGVVPTCAGMMLENAVAFTVYEQLKRIYPKPEKKVGAPMNFYEDILNPMGMGFVTGACSALVLIPSEIVKTKTQMCTEAGISSWDITKRVISRQGVSGLFCGMDAQIMRDGPFYAVFFGGYEGFVGLGKNLFPQVNNEVIYFMSGGFAGMLAWGVAMPFDVPKTAVQGSYESKVVGSYYPAFKEIVKRRGVVGLYAGLMPTLVRAFPSNAALFLGVEMAKTAFDDLFPVERGW